LDAATTAFSEFKRTDGTGVVQGIHDGLANARTAYRQRSTASLKQLGQLRMGMNAVAVLFTLAVAVYFGRASTVLGVREPATTAQMFRDLPPPVKAAPIPAAPTAVTPTTSAGSPPVVVHAPAHSTSSSHRPSRQPGCGR
jgi:hypothetical protein